MNRHSLISLPWKKRTLDQLKPYLHSTGEIWKHGFHSENATITSHFRYVFEETSVREITWLQTIVTPFSKSTVFKIFSSSRKTQRKRFQIPPVWRPFSKSLVSVTDLVWTIGLTAEMRSMHLQISLPQCRRGHRTSCCWATLDTLNWNSVTHLKNIYMPRWSSSYQCTFTFQ